MCVYVCVYVCVCVCDVISKEWSGLNMAGQAIVDFRPIYLYVWLFYHIKALYKRTVMVKAYFQILYSVQEVSMFL